MHGVGCVHGDQTLHVKAERHTCCESQQYVLLQGVAAARLQRAQMYEHRRLFQLLGALLSAPARSLLLYPLDSMCHRMRALLRL
jgi:hypothetical protein